MLADHYVRHTERASFYACGIYDTRPPLTVSDSGPAQPCLVGAGYTVCWRDMAKRDNESTRVDPSPRRLSRSHRLALLVRNNLFALRFF